MYPPPPRPELCGSTRPSTVWAAIAASTALPPCFIMPSAASTARGSAAAAMERAASRHWFAERVGLICAAGAAHAASVAARARETSFISRVTKAHQSYPFKHLPTRDLKTALHPGILESSDPQIL